MAELLEEIRQHDADGTNAMNQNNRHLAEIAFHSAQLKLADACSHLLLKDHSSDLFNCILQQEEILNEKMQKFGINHIIEEDLFSEIFSMDSMFFTYSYIDDQLIKVEQNNNNYRLQIFIVNQKLMINKSLELIPEIVLVAAGHLHLLSKVASISSQISSQSFTVYTTCNEGNVFTITFDEESDYAMSNFKEILNNYSNNSSSDERHKILYQLPSAVELEIESEIAISDGNFQLVLEDNTLIMRVNDLHYPLSHSIGIRKPKPRSFLIKEYSIVINFPSCIPENEILLLEDLICELTSFEIPVEISSFCILLELLDDMENLPKDDKFCSPFFASSAVSCTRTWTEKFKSVTEILWSFMQTNVKKNTVHIFKVMTSPRFVSAVLQASRMNFQDLVCIGLKELLIPLGKSMIADLPVLFEKLQIAVEDCHSDENAITPAKVNLLSNTPAASLNLLTNFDIDK